MKKGKFVNPGCIMEIGSVHLILCHLESLFNMFFCRQGQAWRNQMKPDECHAWAWSLFSTSRDCQRGTVSKGQSLFLGPELSRCR